MRKLLYYGSDFKNLKQITGATIRTRQIYEILSSQFDIRSCTYNYTGVKRKGSVLTKSFTHIKSLYDLYYALKLHSPAVLYTLGASGVKGKLRLLSIWLVLLISGVKPRVIVHIHVGNFFEFKQDGNYFFNIVEGVIYWCLCKARFEFIVLSKSLSCGVTSENIFYLSNIVDFECFSESEMYEKQKRYLSKDRIIQIGFISNFLPGKGHDLVLKSLLNVPDRIADQFELKLVGNFSSAEEEKSIRELIQTLSMKGIRIELIPPFTDRSEIRNFYLSLDLVLLPTNYLAEAQPLVLLEAMASGCFCISSHYRGIPDILDHERLGRLIQVTELDFNRAFCGFVEGNERFDPVYIWRHYQDKYDREKNMEQLIEIFKSES